MEYAGGAIDPATGRVNTGGLMHTLNGPTLNDYYAPFLNWYDAKLAAVPAPSAMLLFISGLIGIAVFDRKNEN